MEECPVCLDVIEDSGDTAVTPCGHRFHLTCLFKSFRGGTPTCPMCRGNIIEPELGTDLSHGENMPHEEDGYAAILERATQNYHHLETMQENDVAWAWTTDRSSWIDVSGMYVDFLKHIMRWPHHVYVDTESQDEIDLFMEDFCDLVQDSMETLTSERHVPFCPPEAFVLKTAFGPAFCDGFTMHQRYIFLLRCMSDVMGYLSETTGNGGVLDDFPLCHVLSGKLVQMFCDNPVQG